MQTNLLGEQKEPVELKESYGGLELCSPNHVSYADVNPKTERWGRKSVTKYPSYKIAKEEFEKEVRRNYKTDIVWVKSKFPDSNGYFWLEGIKIKWELKANWVGDMYHMDLNSYCKGNEGHADYKIGWDNNKSSGRVPNLMTETGYKSIFPSNLDCYSLMKDYLIDLVEYEINYDDKGKIKNRLKEYKLEWEDTGYSPPKQFTLTEMKGGEE